MICGFCGASIPDRVTQTEPCGRCFGGCRKIHCPYCGYANPAPPTKKRPALPRSPRSGNDETD